MQLTRKLAFALLLASACNGPFYMIPGGEFSGPSETELPNDFAFLESGVFELETRPEDPYSVELNYVVREGKLYIDPAEGRSWLSHLRRDPRVRARIQGKIYPLQAVLVETASEREGFAADRFVYRLDARE